MMFRFPSVICTRCTGFFCLAIIKGPPNDIYCIIEEPYKHYFTEKVSFSLLNLLKRFLSVSFITIFFQMIKFGVFLTHLVFLEVIFTIILRKKTDYLSVHTVTWTQP